MYDLDAIARSQRVLAVAAAWNDLAVDFYRDAAFAQAFALQQFKHGQWPDQRARLAIQNDIHAPIVLAAARGSQHRSRPLPHCRLCGASRHGSMRRHA
jgi:hypothetical protein